jgi:hypothetical protein
MVARAVQILNALSPASTIAGGALRSAVVIQHLATVLQMKAAVVLRSDAPKEFCGIPTHRHLDIAVAALVRASDVRSYACSGHRLRDSWLGLAFGHCTVFPVSSVNPDAVTNWTHVQPPDNWLEVAIALKYDQGDAAARLLNTSSELSNLYTFQLQSLPIPLGTTLPALVSPLQHVTRYFMRSSRLQPR